MQTCVFENTVGRVFDFYGASECSKEFKLGNLVFRAIKCPAGDQWRLSRVEMIECPSVAQLEQFSVRSLAKVKVAVAEPNLFVLLGEADNHVWAVFGNEGGGFRFDYRPKPERAAGAPETKGVLIAASYDKEREFCFMKKFFTLGDLDWVSEASTNTSFRIFLKRIVGGDFETVDFEWIELGENPSGFKPNFIARDGKIEASAQVSFEETFVCN